MSTSKRILFMPETLGIFRFYSTFALAPLWLICHVDMMLRSGTGTRVKTAAVNSIHSNGETGTAGTKKNKSGAQKERLVRCLSPRDLLYSWVNDHFSGQRLAYSIRRLAYFNPRLIPKKKCVVLCRCTDARSPDSFGELYPIRLPYIMREVISKMNSSHYGKYRTYVYFLKVTSLRCYVLWLWCKEWSILSPWNLPHLYSDVNMFCNVNWLCTLSKDIWDTSAVQCLSGKMAGLDGGDRRPGVLVKHKHANWTRRYIEDHVLVVRYAAEAVVTLGSWS